MSTQSASFLSLASTLAILAPLAWGSAPPAFQAGGPAATPRAAVQTKGAADPAVAGLIPARWHHLMAREGGVQVVTSHYKAFFGPSGWRITPALGELVTQPATLSFALDSISVGGRSLMSASPEHSAAPVIAGDQVVYRRSDAVAEIYAIGDESMEMMLRIDELPLGRGDLVLRGRLDTRLQMESGAGSDALLLSSDGVPALRWGAATVIDAAGRRQSVPTRIEGSALELRIPASFLQAAELPVLLDPLIGPAQTVAGMSTPEYQPDVAYDPGSDLYLVVWSRHYALFDEDAYGLRVDTRGHPVGSLLIFEQSTALAGNAAAVAFSEGCGKFLVVWREWQDGLDPRPAKIRGWYVDSVAGQIGSAFDITNNVQSHQMPDVGGDPVAPGGFLVAYIGELATVIDEDPFARWVGPGPGSPMGTPINLEPSNQRMDYYPAVSDTCGAAGNWMVVWQHAYNTAQPIDWDVRAVTITRGLGGGVHAGPISMGYSSAPEEKPAVAGDGQEFLAVWEVPDSSGDLDIVGEIRTATGALVRSDFPIQINQDEQRTPCIAANTYAYVVGWIEPFHGGPDLDFFVRQVDRGGNLSTSPEALAVSIAVEDQPAITSNSREGTFLSVFRSSATGNDDIYARPYVPRGASAMVYGHSCPGTAGRRPSIGTGGTIPFPANRDFLVTLNNAVPGGRAALLWGGSRTFAPSLGISLPFNLGPLGAPACDLLTDLVTLVTVGVPGSGSLEFSLPVPDPPILLPGMELYLQWLILDPGAPGSLALTEGLALIWP